MLKQKCLQKRSVTDQEKCREIVVKVQNSTAKYSAVFTILFLPSFFNIITNCLIEIHSGSTKAATGVEIFYKRYETPQGRTLVLESFLTIFQTSRRIYLESPVLRSIFKNVAAPRP